MWGKRFAPGKAQFTDFAHVTELLKPMGENVPARELTGTGAAAFLFKTSLDGVQSAECRGYCFCLRSSEAKMLSRFPAAMHVRPLLFQTTASLIPQR